MGTHMPRRTFAALVLRDVLRAKSLLQDVDHLATHVDDKHRHCKQGPTHRDRLRQSHGNEGWAPEKKTRNASAAQFSKQVSQVGAHTTCSAQSTVNTDNDTLCIENTTIFCWLVSECVFFKPAKTSLRLSLARGPPPSFACVSCA